MANKKLPKRPVHCPACQAERGVAIPAKCPHGKKSKRKFYRQMVHIEVLADDRIDLSSYLDELVASIQDYSVRVMEDDQESVDGPTMAKLLIAQHSDPGFFMLTEDGEDSDA